MQENRKRKASCLEELKEIAKFPNCIIRHCVEPFLQREFDFKKVIGQLNFIFNSQKFSYFSLRPAPGSSMNFAWSNIDHSKKEARLCEKYRRVKKEKQIPEANYAEYFNKSEYVQAKAQWFIRYPEATVFESPKAHFYRVHVGSDDELNAANTSENENGNI